MEQEIETILDIDEIAKCRALFMHNVLSVNGDKFVMDPYLMRLLMEGTLLGKNYQMFDEYMWQMVRCFLEDNLGENNIIAFSFIYPLVIKDGNVLVYIKPDIEAKIYPLYRRYLLDFTSKSNNVVKILDDIDSNRILDDDGNVGLINRLAEEFSLYYEGITKPIVQIGGVVNKKKRFIIRIGQ